MPNFPFANFDVSNVSGSVNDSTVTQGTATTLDFAFDGAKTKLNFTPSTGTYPNVDAFALNIGSLFTSPNQPNGVKFGSIKIDGQAPPVTWSAAFNTGFGVWLVQPTRTSSISAGTTVNIALEQVKPTAGATLQAPLDGAFASINDGGAMPISRSVNFAINSQAGNSDLLATLAPTVQSGRVFSPKMTGIGAAGTATATLKFTLTNVGPTTLSFTAASTAPISLFVPGGLPTATGTGLVASTNQIENFTVNASGPTDQVQWSAASSPTASGSVRIDLLTNQNSFALAPNQAITVNLGKAATSYPPGWAYMSVVLQNVSGYQVACWNMPVLRRYATMKFAQGLVPNPQRVSGGFLSGSTQTQVNLTWNLQNATQVELLGSGFQPLGVPGTEVEANHSTSFVLVGYDQTNGDVISQAATVVSMPNWDTQVLPANVIMAWSGTGTSDLPSGWQVCDGTNQTPDLRNLFIIGSGTLDGATYVTGTRVSTPQVNHVHTASFTVTGSAKTAGAHWHTNSTGNVQGVEVGGGLTDVLHLNNAPGGPTSMTGSHPHGIDTTIGPVTSTGPQVIDQSSVLRPPFYALLYIIQNGNPGND